KCLEITRDVNSPFLFNGIPKKFNNELLSSFFSRDEIKPTGCENPNYQDIHVLGAVFAHNADIFLSLFTQSKEEKYQAVIEWIKYLNDSKAELSMLQPKQYLEET